MLLKAIVVFIYITSQTILYPKYLSGGAGHKRKQTNNQVLEL